MLSRPRRSAVENSLSSSSCTHTGRRVSTGDPSRGPLMPDAQRPSSQQQPCLMCQQVHLCIPRNACVWGKPQAGAPCQKVMHTRAASAKPCILRLIGNDTAAHRAQNSL